MRTQVEKRQNTEMGWNSRKMAKKVHSEVKAAVLLIIQENLSALKDVFTNHGNSISKSVSQNQGPTRPNNKKMKSIAKPAKKS